MSDPCVDLEKGITELKEDEKGLTGLKEEGLKEEEKGITGLKEDEKAVHRYKHLKDMCVLGILDVYSVLFFVSAMVYALIFYRQTHNWLPIVLLLPLSIFNFWYCRRMKHQYIQHTTLASDSGDLSTALLATSKK